MTLDEKSAPVPSRGGLVRGLVSVVIPNWNGESMLPSCLDSLRIQTYSQVEVIVVDNGSTDGSLLLIETDYPEVMLIRLIENRGFAGGVNEGIRSATGEFIGLLNNDAIAQPDWIEQSLSVLRSDASIAAVAAKLVRTSKNLVVQLDSTGNAYSIWGIPFPRDRDEVDKLQFDSEAEVFGLSGGAAVLRADLFERVGLFDPEFFMYHEDVDLSFRARLMGLEIRYAPKAVVTHAVGRSSGGSYNPQVRYHSVKNVWYVYLKNMPTPLFWRYLPRFMAAQVLMFVSSIIRGLVVPHIKGLVRVAVQMPKIVSTRRIIQQGSVADPKDIDRLLTRELPPIYKSELKRLIRRPRSAG